MPVAPDHPHKPEVLSLFHLIVFFFDHSYSFELLFLFSSATLNDISDNALSGLNSVVTWTIVDEEFHNTYCTFISVFIIPAYMRLTIFSGRPNCLSVHLKIQDECNHRL